MLEADLWRSEAKIAALANPNSGASMRNARDSSVELVTEEAPTNKEEGMQRWREVMELRFLRGQDTDFDYKQVDESVNYDDWGTQEQEEQEKWFEEEEPAWVEQARPDQDTITGQALTGQTGVQDY